MGKNFYRAKTIKDKSEENKDNISNYENLKILYKLSKPRSPQSIVFIEDENDPFLIDVKYYQTKSGEIKDSFTILKPDLENNIDKLLRLGYIKK
jgi:hypothetical protein